MNLNEVDALALQEQLQLEKQIEAEVSASADAKSNTPSWWRIRQCDQLYIEQLILQLSAMAHGKAVAIDWNQFDRVRKWPQPAQP